MLVPAARRWLAADELRICIDVAMLRLIMCTCGC